MTSTSDIFTPPIAYYVSYLGSTVVGKKHTQSILPWILCELKRKGDHKYVMLEISCPNLRTTLTDGSRDVLFEYPLRSLSRLIQTKTEPKCFGFLHKETRKLSDPNVYTCHTFLAHNTKTVSTCTSICNPKSVNWPPWSSDPTNGWSTDPTNPLLPMLP